MDLSYASATRRLRWTAWIKAGREDLKVSWSFGLVEPDLDTATGTMFEIKLALPDGAGLVPPPEADIAAWVAEAHRRAGASPSPDIYVVALGLSVFSPSLIPPGNEMAHRSVTLEDGARLDFKARLEPEA